MKHLLTRDMMHLYQGEAVNHANAHYRSMLWLGMGLGKTVITLTSIVDRINAGQVKKVLIFGPVRVINSVWAQEAQKWEHTKHLRFSTIHGTPTRRSRAMFADADVHMVNYENANWFCEQLLHYYIDQGKPLPYDMVVYDEISKFKNSTSKRMAGGYTDRTINEKEVRIKLHGWRKMIPHFTYRMGLTGTPAANGYADLFGQFLVIDGGERLGEYVTHFKQSYFKSDYMGWSSEVTNIGKQYIEQKISDITLKMDAKDYLDLPAVKVTNMMVTLPPKARKAYDEMEAQMFAALDNGSELEVFSKSAVSNKCCQICLAGETEVLTSNGWKRIDEFRNGDKVWDGEEWVSVYELAFQGVKPVVKCDGVRMTPDHRVLTVSGWKEAQEIINGNDDERFNRVKVRLPDYTETTGINTQQKQESNMVSPMRLWKGDRCDRAKPSESESKRGKVLRVQKGRSSGRAEGHSRNVKQPRWLTEKRVCCVDQPEIPMSESKRQRLQELRCKRYPRLRRMVRLLPTILGGHGCNIPITLVHRTSEQFRRISQRELSVGYTQETVEQPANLRVHSDSSREDVSRSSSKTVQVKTCDIEGAFEEGVDGREGTETCRVYDLINSGKRNRFTVRGVDGQVFIVHNCNGAAYLSAESDEWTKVHDAKLDALEEVLEEAGGSPVLCSYSFKADAQRIMTKFKKYKPVNLTAEKASATAGILKRWREGKIKLLVGHPASMGHGIDGLQDTGHIMVWFGMNWSLELYEQMNARIDRQGQTHPVSIIRILCNDTVDLAVADAIERKNDSQTGLKNALQRYRKGITTNALEVNFF